MFLYTSKPQDRGATNREGEGRLFYENVNKNPSNHQVALMQLVLEAPSISLITLTLGGDK